MEQPVSRVVRAEAEDDVTVVGNGDGVFSGRQVELSMQETLLIKIESVFQIDFLHVLVGRTADTDYVERVSVQMERMRQIGLLYFVYEHHLDDRVVRNVDLMRAHTVGAAISRSIITVTELFRWDVIDLRERRRRWERERDLVHERNHVVTGRRNEEAIVGLWLEDLFWSVEQEAERQEDLHVRALLQNTLIDVAGVLQLAHANRIFALSVANGIQRIQDNALRKTKVICRWLSRWLIRTTSIS